MAPELPFGPVDGHGHERCPVPSDLGAPRRARGVDARPLSVISLGPMDTFGVDHAAVDGKTHAFRLTLRGELDQSTTDKLRSAIDDLITDGARLIVLDLADVSFLDSTGLRAILAAAQMLRDRDGRLTCEGLSGAAGRVLELTGTLETLRGAASRRANDLTRLEERGRPKLRPRRVGLP